MSYALGIDVGTSYTAAAIWRLDGHQQSTEVVPLGSRMPAVSSVLFLGAQEPIVGEAAERRSVTDPDRVVREFKRRIGDDTPLFVGGQPYAAHDLAATMVRWVVDRVTEREGGTPDRIAITHPAGWGPFKKDLVRTALRARGLDNLTFLAEPEAAAVSYAAQARVEVDTTIAVYDLGGGTFDAAVVRKTGAGSFTLMGSAEGIEQLGGADFDEAVFTYVQANLGDQLDGLDVEDPNVLSGLARLRRECTEAKEALSSDTEVSISVLLPGVNAQVRLVRSEFEEMIRPALEDTVDSLSRAISSAGLTSADLGAVLLVGGSSRVPLVSQLVSARLGCPVVVDTDPKTTIASGAALSMAPQPEPVTMTPIAAPPQPAEPEADLRSHHGHLPDQAPDRPPTLPTQRQGDRNREPATANGPLRNRLLAGVVFSIVAVGLIVGALLTSQSSPSPTGALDDPPTIPAQVPEDPDKINPVAGGLQSRGGTDEQAPGQEPSAATNPSTSAAAGTHGGRATTPAPPPPATNATNAPPPPAATTAPPPQPTTTQPPPTTTTPPPLPTTTATTTTEPPPTTTEPSPTETTAQTEPTVPAESP